MQKKNSLDLLQESILNFWNITPYQDIVSWAVENIDFSDDISAERTKLDLSLTPHLVEPLKQWEFDGVIREVQIIGIEQHGKTLLEIIGALYSMIYKPCSMLVAYPSDELSFDINRSKYEPLISKIPQLAAELDKPFCKRQDRYRFSNSTMFFQGAGRKIVSKSCKIRIADELSAWPSIGSIDNFEDLKKRGRSYSESILYSVTTVRYDSDKAWKNFLDGSQGYWTLQCKGCGEHAIRSCDLHHLQFDSVYDETTNSYVLKNDSIRLICPKCGYEHVEADKYQMNRNGKYIHKFSDRIKEKPSYQFGVLCSLFPFMSWSRIAEKILSSGKRSDKEALEEFDNSWRGLPYQVRKISRQDQEHIKQHFFTNPPLKEDVEFCFITSDTQDLFNPSAFWVVDRFDNLYMIDYQNFDYLYLTEEDRNKINARNKLDNKPPITTLEDWLDRDYEGIKPLFMVIDKRGHRTQEIEAFARRRKNIFQYAGTSLKYEKYKLSTNLYKTILVSARAYQADLIFYLYNQKNKLQNYLYLTPTLKDETLAEITCVQADNTKKMGHLAENWEPLHDAVHDAFDVCKMAIFAKDFAIKTFERKRFLHCESPSLKRRFAELDERKNKKNLNKIDSGVVNQVSNSWFSNYR